MKQPGGGGELQTLSPRLQQKTIPKYENTNNEPAVPMPGTPQNVKVKNVY